MQQNAHRLSLQCWYEHFVVFRSNLWLQSLELMQKKRFVSFAFVWSKRLAWRAALVGADQPHTRYDKRSAGIAPNYKLAKICSDERKPNNQYILRPDTLLITKYMKKLDVRRVPGIGPSAEYVLNGLNIKTCGDIIEQRAKIWLLFSGWVSLWVPFYPFLLIDNNSSYYLRAALGVSSIEIDSDDNENAREWLLPSIVVNNFNFQLKVELVSAVSALLHRQMIELLSTKLCDTCPSMCYNPCLTMAIHLVQQLWYAKCPNYWRNAKDNWQVAAVTRSSFV